MSRRSAIDAAFAARPASAARLEASNYKPIKDQSAETVLEASNVQRRVKIRSGAIAAMGASLEHLAARADAADQMETGIAVVDLDPALIDGSFVKDRVADAADRSLGALVDSIRDSGQHVPILVRPHPERPGRFQIAYGHRRVLAATQLAIRVRAIVRTLTDAELVVAQGKENLDRRDLSYIERAFFAFSLEKMSFPRDVIGSAMGVHKSDLSNFLTVARSIPEDVVAAIGPAPKVGGPRWRMLADQLGKGGREPLDALLRKAEFRSKPSDDRFLLVFQTLASRSGGKAKADHLWNDDQGRQLASIQRTDRRFVLSFDEKLEPGLGDYLVERLPEILAAHRARKA